MYKGYYSFIMDKNIKKTFGKRLKQLRKKKGLTQKELAANLDIGLSQFNKYEGGLHIPPADKLVELSRILDVSLDFLLTGHENDLSLHNLRLLKRFQALENFDSENQEAVIIFLDAMILKNKVQGAIKSIDE
jgi:transcriptional regulator with XRE-family HTH domain